MEIVIRVALDGIGLAFVGEDKIVQDLASGALTRVLDEWCQLFRFLPLLPEPTTIVGGTFGFDEYSWPIMQKATQ
ncbi:MAG TPA: hypothetical protein VKX49_20285 [Bryobacteraceae bacterium]|nr:hypothetical protein [Bryobacteraceae bacterium]